MSGGKFDYAFFKIEMLADDIESAEKDLYFEENELSIEERQNICDEIDNLKQDLRHIAKRAKALEWWMSGDYGDRSYYNKLKDIKGEL